MTQETNKLVLPDSNMAFVHNKERREERFRLAIEIEVSGIDENGQMFRYNTVTNDVSEWGCAFLAPIQMQKDDLIALRVVSVNESPTPFQVTNVVKQGDGWRIGTWKLGDADVWHVDLKKLSEQSNNESGSADKKDLGTGITR
jgi:hypothetical protein